MYTFRIGLIAALTIVTLLPSHAQTTWRTDSLMATWAVQQRARELEHISGRGVVRAVDTRDLYSKLRQEAPGITVFADSLVVHYAELYGEPLRDQFKVLLGFAQVRFPMISKELALNGLPDDLKYLPMALSAMNSQAGSRTGGSGLWMLTYPVAIRYGLEVTALVDERRDDAKSTAAACRYLKDLNAHYQDPGLVLMAFACGPANVVRAQQRSGGATDLRSLYVQVTEEQQDILPLLMAFIHLTTNANALGLQPFVIDPWEETDTLSIARNTSWRALAQVLKVPERQLRAWNPTLVGDEVPAGRTFQLPLGTRARYEQLADSVQHVDAALAAQEAEAPTPTIERPVAVMVTSTIHYKVRSGDNLGKIAEKHRVTVKQLKTWNKLRSDRIDVGDRLVIQVKKRELVQPKAIPEPNIPEGDGDEPMNRTHTAPPLNGAVPQPLEQAVFISYTVQSGDSLYRIAERYPGVSAQLIMETNGIDTMIKPGQKLKIPRP